MESNQKYVCRICSNKNNNKTFVAREMMLGFKDEFLYFECSACKCLQIAEFPNDISKYYPSDYYSLRKKKKSHLRSIAGITERFRIMNTIFPRPGLSGLIIQSLFPLKKVNFLHGIAKSTHDRILDVGCGNGRKFLLPLYRAGFTKVEGCDPYIEEDDDYHGKTLIHKKRLSEISGEWDIITFNHSFEHLENPLEILQTVNKLLKRDGYCIIRIPTSSSFAWQHYGINWFQLDAPRHIFLHSIESIGILSEKTGFKLTDIKYDSTHHQFTLSERYKQGKILKERSYSTLAGRLVSALRKIAYTSRASKLNKQKKGDQAIFYLQKMMPYT